MDAPREAKEISEQTLLNANDEESKSCLRLITEGLSDGFMSRAKSDPGSLCTELTVAAATGVALQKMAQAGGRWGCAAKIIGGTLAMGFGADAAHRGNNIYDAFSETTNDVEGQAIRQKAIADNAGTALFDYPLIGLAGMGAARLASGPRAALHTSEAQSPASNAKSEALASWEKFNSKPPEVIEWRPGQSEVKKLDLIGSKTTWTDGPGYQPSSLEWRPGTRLLKEVEGRHQMVWNLKTEIVGPDGMTTWVAKNNTFRFNEPLALADHMHKIQDRLNPILRETPTDTGQNALRITEEIKTGNGVTRTRVLYDRPVPMSNAIDSYRSINELMDPYAYRFVPGVVEATRPNLHPGEIVRPPMQLTEEQIVFQKLWEHKDSLAPQTKPGGTGSDSTIKWEDFNSKPGVITWRPWQN